jgi:hypothetical protein
MANDDASVKRLEPFMSGFREDICDVKPLSRFIQRDMRGIYLAASLLLMLAGCGDPETSRFKAGARAFVAPHDGKMEDAYLAGARGLGLDALVLGTHVTVVSDEDDPEHDWSSREVTVHVEEGDAKGKTGKLVRWSLRPE